MKKQIQFDQREQRCLYMTGITVMNRRYYQQNRPNHVNHWPGHVIKTENLKTKNLRNFFEMFSRLPLKCKKQHFVQTVQLQYNSNLFDHLVGAGLVASFFCDAVLLPELHWMFYWFLFVFIICLLCLLFCFPPSCACSIFVFVCLLVPWFFCLPAFVCCFIPCLIAFCLFACLFLTHSKARTYARVIKKYMQVCVVRASACV